MHFFICSSPPHTSAEGAGRIPHQRGITLLADRKQLYNLLYKALSGIDVSSAIKKKKKIRPDCLWQLMKKIKKNKILIAVRLHHTVAQGFINTSRLGLCDWMFGSH